MDCITIHRASARVPRTRANVARMRQPVGPGYVGEAPIVRVRIAPDQRDELDALAAARGVTRSEIVRQAITQAIEKELAPQ